MKKLILIIVIPILIVVGLVGTGLALLYDGSGDEQLPFEVYNDGEDGKTLLFMELNDAITAVENGDAEDVLLNINEDIINRYIYDQILSYNEDYAPGPDCQTPDECYIFAEGGTSEDFEWGFHIVGAWVTLIGPETVTDMGSIVLNVYLEFNVNNNFAYKTVLEVHFNFKDTIDEYYLEFDRLEMGSIPVPNSFFTTIIGIIEDQANIDLESEIGDIPIGEFDLETLSYTLQKDEILTKLAEGDSANNANMLLLQELLTIVFDNNYVVLEIADEEIELSIAVSKISSDDDPGFPEYLYDLHDQEVVNGETIIGEFNPELFDAEAYLKDLFTEYIFSSALIDGTGFTIHEETFNKLVYYNMNGFADARSYQEIQISDTETKQLEVGLKGMWFDFEDGEIYVNALFRIGSIDSLMVLHAVEVPTTDDTLQFEFTDITIGKDATENPIDYVEIADLSTLKQVFADIGDVQFGEFNADGDLIISASRLTALMEDGTTTGAVVVNGISVDNTGITLDIAAGDATFQAALESFQTALETVIGSETLLTDLEALLDETDGGVEQAVYDTVSDLQDAISSGGTVDTAQVEELFNSLEELDPTTQDEFLNTVTSLIDTSTLEGFETLFGTIVTEETTGE